MLVRTTPKFLKTMVVVGKAFCKEELDMGFRKVGWGVRFAVTACGRVRT